jgi:four helix bundle protein
MRCRFRFEKLTVWQEARKYNGEVYRLTRTFPKEELFGMTSQLRRASTSIASNIAEGSGRNSDRDFAHFLEQAYGSLMEVASLLFLAADEGYVTENLLNVHLDKADQLARQLASLNRSLSVEASKTPFPRRGPDSRPSTFDSRP